ncbi:hypothetical protein [Alteribacter aurantiacus]|uniref:hypothetical protein n=1 Tax=Alteribacter aurantiacus TaxID=254410 RepID=UPI00042A910E|nr:hypothetical protein [Alteribacter aurantiacus]
MNAYAKFLGAKKEKDRHMVFRILDYLSYVLFALFLLVMITDIALLPDVFLVPAFFFIVTLYIGGKAVEGLVDGVYRVMFIYGPPALLSFVTGIVLLFML